MAEYEPTLNESTELTCEITGKVFPADEIVEFQGKRVSAEGKQILMDKLAAGEAMPGELEKPSAFRRFACMFVDGIVLWIINMAILFVAGIVTARAVSITGGAAFNPEDPSSFFLFQGVVGLITGVIQFGYFTLLHAKYGQTLGKMAGKVKVINADGSEIGMRTASLRSLFYIGPNILVAVIMILGIFSTSESFIVIVGFLGMACGGYWILSVIMALVDRERQRALHDRFAKTRVIALD